ncbi:ABC transporter permease [Algibacter sp. Ld11]|uniref:ABC transporter permease n=1 Tax=Algibacter sp. Ld11 TaxID=649150 RepID=UPI0038687682
MELKLIWRLIKKEALLIFNDKSIFLVLFAAPFLYLFLIGTTYIKKDEEKVSIGAVDLDHTTSSRSFLNKLNATQKVEITQTYNNLLEAKDGLSNFDIQGYVNIPHGFEKKLKMKEASPIGLILNNTRFLPSNDINKAVNLVALEYALDSRSTFFQSKGVSPTLAKTYADPVSIEVHAVYNPTNNYGNFLLPFVLFLILNQTLLIGLAESVASDREKGLTLTHFTASKNNFLNYIIGKTAIYFVLFFAYTLLVLLVVFPLFHLQIHGNLFMLLVASSIFLITTILYGWFVASFFKTEIGAMEVIAFTSYPIFLITGVTWSISQMPMFIQYIANLLPLRPFFVVIKKLAIMDVDSNLYNKDIVHLLLLLFIGYALAFLRFRHLQRKTVNKTITVINFKDS